MIVSVACCYLLSVVCVCGCLYYSNCMQQILESVDYCHQMNVVHRDLKVRARRQISMIDWLCTWSLSHSLVFVAVEKFVTCLLAELFPKLLI